MMQENEVFVNLAREFFASKEHSVAYYDYIGVFDDEIENGKFRVQLDEPTLAGLHALREKYGEKTWLKHLKEVIADDDMRYDTLGGNDDDIVDIKLDEPVPVFDFAIHELTSKGMRQTTVSLDMKDEDYIRLLAICVEDPTMNFNKLRYADKKLYDFLRSEIDWYFTEDGFYMGANPFLVTMDEVLGDAEAILQAHPELKNEPYSGCGYMFR